MGEQIRANFRNPEFSELSAPEYKLSILMGVDSLCFELFGNSGRSLRWKDLSSADPLASLMHEPMLLESPFQGLSLALCQTNAVLVPARLFDPDRVARYWESLSRLPDKYTVGADHLTAPNAWLVYPVREDIRQALPQAGIFHLASAWLQAIADTPNAAASGGVYAHVFGNLLLLAGWNSGELQFFNIFTFQSANDFLYYVLLAFQQAKLSAESAGLFLSGKISKQAEIYLVLQRYCNHIAFFAPDEAGPYPYGLPKEHHHWYLDLCCVRRR